MGGGRSGLSVVGRLAGTDSYPTRQEDLSAYTPTASYTRSGGVPLKALGFDISAGVAYAVLIDPDTNEASTEPLDRLEVPEAAMESDAYSVVVRSLQQHLRDIRPSAVGILETTKFRNWAYRQAAERARIEASVVIAAGLEAVPGMVVPVSRATDVLETEREALGEVLAARFDLTALTYSDQRANAAAAAFVALDEA